MRTTDLMVGDWVFNKFLNKNIRITPYDFFSKYPKVIEGNDLEPIPLTAEILEKNGWKYEDYANEYSTESEEYFVYEDFDIYINNDGKFQITSMDTININLDYVHQLQHALKLCGIEKDIEL